MHRGTGPGARSRVAAACPPPRAHERQGVLDPDQSRQKLGAPGTRHQPEPDLGQAQLRVGEGDPPATAQRDLEPAAQRITVDGREPRLRAGLDRRDHAGQIRPLWRSPELVQIGSGHEAAAGAEEDGPVDGLVCGHRAHRLEQTLAHYRREHVHRWVVDLDDSEIAITLDAHR